MLEVLRVRGARVLKVLEVLRVHGVLECPRCAGCARCAGCSSAQGARGARVLKVRGVLSVRGRFAAKRIERRLSAEHLVHQEHRVHLEHSSTLAPMRILCGVLLIAGVIASSALALSPEVLRSISAIPPDISGRFREPSGFQQSSSGQYFVFDRRGHTVYGIDERQTTSWDIVHIGPEPGRIIDPTAFAVAPDGTFVVADAPNNRERIQIFTPAGARIGGFVVRGRLTPRVTLNSFVIGGIGSLQYTGTSILMSQPETGALISEYTLAGDINRLIGTLRHTGREDDRELHLALNTGMPLFDPTGGFFFVFQTGEPMFRKYDRGGQLVFERRIEGREIEDLVGKLPTTWPRRNTSDGDVPVVSPTIRTAAVDPSGHLWVSFVVPYTYVFDGDGDKIRTLQFRGAGIISPNSFFFTGKGRILVTPGLYEFAP